MSVRTIEVLQRYLRRLCDEAVPAEDAVLLHRFVTANDRDAFELLIARYGPMVLGTARRLVADTHDAEDVFQAVFLSLARLAKSIRRGRALPAWLHKTTCRVAAKLRANRRVPAAPPPERYEQCDPAAGLVWGEVCAALDEELQRLPERLRSPLVLCYLSGLTRDEAAKQLGWPLGTLKRRLEEGRNALRVRLARRGIASLGLALTVLTPETLQAAVRPALGDSTLRFIFSKGAAVSATVSALVLNSAGTMKGLAMKSILGLLAAIALGAGIYAGTGQADPPMKAEGKKEEVKPVPEENIVHQDDPLPAGSTLRFGTSRFRHGASVSSMAVSADGKRAVAANDSDATRVFDLVSGRALYSLGGPGSTSIEAAAFSPDGRTIVTKQDHSDLSLRVRDATTGKELRKIELPRANPRSQNEWVAFTPDGKALAVTSQGNVIHLIDFESGRTIRDFSNDNPEHPGWESVLGITFSADGKLMASGGFTIDKGTYFARLWEVATGKELRRFMHAKNSYGIPSLAFSPLAKTLATRSHDGRLRLFDVDTGKQRHTFPADGGGRKLGTVAIAPDGRTVAAAGDSIRLYDVTTGEERLRIDRRQASHLHFTDGGKTLTGAVDGAIYRWDTTTGKALTPEAGDSAVAQVLVSADGSRVVTRGSYADAHIWDGTTAKHLRRFPAGWQRNLAMSPDGRFLAWPVDDDSVQFTVPQEPDLTYYGSRIRLYDIAGDKVVDRFPAFKGSAQNLVFSGDGKKLVLVDQHPGMVRVWDFEAAKEERSFPITLKASDERSYIVVGTSLSPDSKTAVVTYQEDRGGREFGGLRGPPQHVRLWDVATGKELAYLDGGYPVDGAFSPDGRLVATNGGNSVKVFSPDGRLVGPTGGNFVYETATGYRVAELPAEALIQAAAFSRDGRFLATAVYGGVIQIWEAATWTKRNEFKDDRSQSTTLTFAPSGELLSGNQDTTALAWDMRPPRAPGSVTLESAWNDLAKRDAAETFKTEGRFLATPTDAVKFFAERIKPGEALDPKRVGRLLADLGSDEFAVRQAASKALAGLDEQATPYLEETLRSTDSLEVRVRVTRMLEQRRGIALTTDQIRQIRAVMVLERIGDGEAKDLLKRWAGGSGGSTVDDGSRRGFEAAGSGVESEPVEQCLRGQRWLQVGCDVHITRAEPFFKKEAAMRRNTLILVALIAVMAAGTVLTIERTSRGQDAWRPPIEGLICHRDASLYYIKNTGNTVVIYLPGEWGASARGSSDAETKTFITDVTLKAKGKPDVSIKGGSAKPNQLVVNGKSFDLAAGSVLRVDAGGQVFPLPFQPLPPTHEYLQSLRKYISDREGGNR